MAKQRKRQAKSKSKDQAQQAMPNFLGRRLSEGRLIIFSTLALFIMLALASYQDVSPLASTTSNKGGWLGHWLAGALFYLLGYAAYFLPIVLMSLAWLMHQDYRRFHGLNRQMWFFRGCGLALALMGSCALMSLLLVVPEGYATFLAGGRIGYILAHALSAILNPEGATLILMASVLVAMTWLTGLPWMAFIEALGRYTMRCTRQLMALNDEPSLAPSSSHTPKLNLLSTDVPVPKIIEEQYGAATTDVLPSLTPLKLAESTTALAQDLPKQEKIKEAKENKSIKAEIATRLKSVRSNKSQSKSGLPSLSLLEKGGPVKPLGGFSHQVLEHLSRQVEQHLLDFGVHVDVVAVHPGPVITRFELQLAAGVKVSKLSGLAKDLARSLSVTSVRVVEIIPGKTVVGLELPNEHRAMVRFGDVLSSEVYQHTQSPLALALGVDIAGHPMVVDLAKMPHLLVAGTTGSGKSVGINAMILSVLFKATPEQVRLIMIDPKMLELSVYDGIPHLLTPVVTDMKEAASALRWCVAEMERRYRLMSALGVRNLAGFNSKIQDAQAAGTPISDPIWKAIDGMSEAAPALQPLPYIVVIIDELADMMMVVGKKVEQLIARIAQKARAAGIHLILATQRPSVDVLTGLIKSNIPTRISFQVSSKIDSRTILDQQGAEQLLGHGDMLYLAPGTGAPLRVHGAFVDDQEVHRVADDWRARGEPEYIEEITQLSGEGIDGGFDEAGSDATEDTDPLYDQAVEFVLQTRKASISAVQRRFKIGYNRAARLVEEMERTGIVGPLDGGYRDVLVTHVLED